VTDLGLLSLLLTLADPPVPVPVTVPAAAAATDADVGTAAAAPRMTEMVVTGSRTEEKRQDSTTAVEVIDRAAIEAAGAENVAEVLEAHPGVDLEPSYRGLTVRLQGLDPEYVLVLVDGERTQGRLGGTLDVTRFSTDDVERIEIVKGAGSALYGSDAVAGVVNIITRRARQGLEAGGHLSGGTQGTMDASARLGGRHRGLDGLLTFGHHRADAWDLTPETAGTTASAATSWNLGLAGGWRSDEQFSVRARGHYLRRDQTGVGNNDSGALFDRQMRSEDATLTVEPQWRFGGGSRLRLTGHGGLFVDQLLSDQRGSNALDQLQKTEETLARTGAQLDLVLGPRHLLVTGAELLHERMTSPRIAGGETDRTRTALFAQHEWRWLDQPRLALLPGVRLDTDSQFGWHVSPKLALRFDPHPTVTLRAAYGLAYRAPSFQELYLAFDNRAAGYMVAGNPALEPESSASLNLGAEWRPDERWLLSAGAFRTSIDDLIIVRLGAPEQIGEPSRYSYANVARARTRGLEGGLGLQLQAGLRIDLGYTITDARDLEGDEPLEGQARHRGTFRLGYRHAGAGFSGQARGSLVGERPFYVDENGDGAVDRVAAPAYATLGVRLQQRLWRVRGASLDAFVGGDNLLDAGEELYLPVAPRTFYGGVDLAY
jgi:outer membrane receptor for ferrienterochelin and colicins